MKVKVIKNYVDRNTKELMETGSTIEYEDERAHELEAGGYVQIIDGKEVGENELQKGSQEK